MVRMLAALALLAALLPATAEPRDLLVEAEIEPARVHVQTQAIYRLRFYQGVDVRDLAIVGPAAPLAEIRPLGAIRVRETQRDGRRYRVHEASWAVFPFASGGLELAGAHVAGRVADTATGAADGRRTLRLDAPAQRLEVLPIPADAPGPAARALTLHETWSPADGPARVGEALRRTIRVEAAGIDAGQLPELRFEIPGVAVHAEPARLTNHLRGELNIAWREQAFVLVPQRGDAVVVPELHLPWWDIAAGAAAQASLPARTLAPAGEPPAPAASPIPVAATAPAAGPAISRLPAGIVLVLCLAAALGWHWRADWRAAWHLHRACRSGRAAAVRDALLARAAGRWPDSPPATLPALAERLSDPAARRALERIDCSLYGPSPGGCGADELAAAVRLVRRGLSLRWRDTPGSG